MAFENLTAPQIVEEISFETILEALMDDATARFAASGITYDVGVLETDPVKITQEPVAYREVMIRARGNAIALENLVAFATGSNLDHLAAFYDVTRLVGETDDRLRTRVALAVSGRSTAGGKDWYKAAAMRASVRVRDVAVYRTGIGPELNVAVLATDNGGLADGALLNDVNTEIQRDDVRVISDVINVVAAVSTVVNVSAQIWLLPTASQTVFTTLEATVRALHAAEGGLGFDLKRSWLLAKLHQPGVSRVELVAPVADIVVTDNQAIQLGTVTLTDMGRDR